MASAGSAIDAYWEYTRTVGEDDGGKLMTPSEYEAYKKKVLPMRLKNRLYVSWTNSNNMDCKLIGPETLCFCGHRFRSHQTDFESLPLERPITLACKQNNCPCETYNFIPTNGGTSIRCSCKHEPRDHAIGPIKNCRKATCKCNAFRSDFPCGCGESYNMHKTVVETKDERLQNGKPVGHDTPYQAMGGITGFSSLIDGYMRLDSSGIGRPSDEILNATISKTDHPFLRVYGGIPITDSEHPRSQTRPGQKSIANRRSKSTKR